MTTLPTTQTCPYCDHDVEDCHAEWEETNDVECDRCRNIYSVTPEYKFLGFTIEKYCKDCCEKESECFCDDEEVEE
jgi:hypothetical protein